MCQGTREKKTQTTWQSVPAAVKWSPEGNESCPHNLHLNLSLALQQESKNICLVLALTSDLCGWREPAALHIRRESNIDNHWAAAAGETYVIHVLARLSCTDGCFTLAPGAQGISYTMRHVRITHPHSSESSIRASLWLNKTSTLQVSRGRGRL